MRVLLFGATGTIGKATVRALIAPGHEVLCVCRPGSGADLPDRAERVEADVTSAASVKAAFEAVGKVDAVMSCLASRTGSPKDAWAIDHAAHVVILKKAVAAGVPRFVQLSALCVQKPALAFQHAKLAFEDQLKSSPLDWTIVRPTAFFKSLSGQWDRVRAGKPFLLFGDGTLTACKPISDRDLAAFMVACLDDPAARNAVMPVGGSGPAITPHAQARLLCAAAGVPVKTRKVPVAMMHLIVGGLTLAGKISPRLAEKAELARIGRYYATESMLVWDGEAGRYDAEATPETGSDTLAGHYAQMARGEVGDERGAHAVF
ncbi:NAD(P)H-binding protein [Pseudaestuariivita atlantica]|uniref:Divinyl chlorophyllide a 8-vinyl-reductase, chloroplastic n=1 Tax=Pseudaestuariivita atlantica TaxID=1317121 RepID=A0A0L1JNQ4_9RHOB|nr:NAD(P)H-binding protein [Pseudaestuariivita atlantica]KNG93395.1 epimerase [Pseudaestuariivita atlantica]